MPSKKSDASGFDLSTYDEIGIQNGIYDEIEWIHELCAMKKERWFLNNVKATYNALVSPQDEDQVHLFIIERERKATDLLCKKLQALIGEHEVPIHCIE